MKKVLWMTSRMSFLLLGLLIVVTCFAGAANAAQYLGVADNSPGSGGVEFYDISAATPTMVGFVRGSYIGGGIYGIAFGPNNDVFVTRTGDLNVYRAPYLGNGVWQDNAWSVAFAMPAGAGPMGLAYDTGHNKMYVTAPSTSLLYNYDFSTSTLSSNDVGIGGGRGAAVVQDKVWMGFSAEQYIGRLDTTTGLREAMNSTAANADWPNALGDGTFGVCGAPDGGTGTAYYTGYNNPYIYRYQVNSPSDWDRTNNSYTVFINDPEHSPAPLGIAIGTDRDGDGVRDIFVADYYQKVVIYSGSDGAYLGTFADNPDNWWGTPRYIAVTAVPEPSALVALMAGCAGLLGLRRRR